MTYYSSHSETKEYLHRIRSDLIDALVKMCSDKPNDPHALLAEFMLGRSKTSDSHRLISALHASPHISGITRSSTSSNITLHWDVNAMKRSFYHEYEISVDTATPISTNTISSSSISSPLYPHMKTKTGILSGPILNNGITAQTTLPYELSTLVKPLYYHADEDELQQQQMTSPYGKGGYQRDRDRRDPYGYDSIQKKGPSQTQAQLYNQLYIGPRLSYDLPAFTTTASLNLRFRVRGRTDQGWSGWSEPFLYSVQGDETFDAARKGDYIELSPDHRTATATNTNQTVAVTSWHRTGVHHTFLRVDQSAGIHGEALAIGIINRDFHGFQQGFLGYDEHSSTSCGVSGAGLKYPQVGVNANYPIQFHAGDVVKVTLDMDHRSLSYAVNGQSCGIAFNGLQDEVCVAISLYAVGESITLLTAQQAADYENAFSPTLKGDMIALSSDHRTATAQSHGQIISTTTWLTKGIHDFHFRIDAGRDLIIGVVNKQFNGYQNGSLGVGDYTHTSWALQPSSYRNNPNHFINEPLSPSRFASPEITFQTGDIIRICVNMDTHTLTYHVNGAAQGLGIAGISGDAICVAVALPTPGDSITFLIGSAITQRSPFNNNPNLPSLQHANYPYQNNNNINNNHLYPNNNISSPIRPYGVGINSTTSPIPSYVTSSPYQQNNIQNNGPIPYTAYNNNKNNSFIQASAPYLTNNNPSYNINTLQTTLNGLSINNNNTSLITGLFDTQRKGNFIKLTENNRTATATTENQTIATTNWLSQGVHSVAFRINYEHQYICIGVVNRSFNGYQSGFLGYGDHIHHSWGITTGSKYPDDLNHGYAAHFKSGDVVRITVDMVSRSLSYTVNGIQYGRAFEEIPESELCVAVSLHNIGDSITIL